MERRTTLLTAGLFIAAVAALGIYYLPEEATAPKDESEIAGGAGGGSEGGGVPKLSLFGSRTVLKTYTDFQYYFTMQYPSDVQYNVSNPGDVSFAIGEGKVSISTAGDVTHLAYCLVAPPGAKNVATTTINGVKFLSYTGSTALGLSGSTTVTYKTLHTIPSGKICYDMRKRPTQSSAINSRLSAIVQSFRFK